MDTKYSHTFGEIAHIREQKGKEDGALKMIAVVMKEAKEKKSYSDLVVLNWEVSLVWQHIAMTEFAKELDKRDNEALSNAKVKMAEHAKEAFSLVEEHGIEKKRATALRFLGRVSDYSDKPGEAIKYYEQALEAFSPDSEGRLEINAFLSASKIMSGDTAGGMVLAKKAYEDFVKDPLGNKLKEKDPYAWMVWRSGIAPRVHLALENSGVSYDKDAIREWLRETLSELQEPPVKVTWGDDKFSFRVDEVQSSLEKLS